MFKPNNCESTVTTMGKDRYLSRLIVLVFIYLSILNTTTLSDDYNIVVYTHRDFYATKFKTTPIFLKFALTDHSDIITGSYKTIFKKYLTKGDVNLNQDKSYFDVSVP